MNRPWTRLYAPGVPQDLPPLAQDHLARFVRSHAAIHRDRPAFSVCLPGGQGGTTDYAKIDSLSDDFAAYLREELKLAQGDRVAVQMPNCLAYPVAAFGILKAGCVLVNVNPLYTPSEVSAQLVDSGAKALVVIDLFAGNLDQSLPSTQVKHVVTASLTVGFPALQGMIVRFVLKKVKKQVPDCPVPHTQLREALRTGRSLRQGKDLGAYIAGQGAEDVACLQYTGGTTGVSKGACLTHANLLSNVEQAYQFCKHRIIPEQEVVLAPLPLYHIFAFTVNLLTFFRTGAHTILVPSPRPISNLKAAFKKFPLTWMTGVNTLYAALLNEDWFKAEPPKHMKVAIAGGTALHGAVAEKWRLMFGDPITEGYGLTEASPVVAFNPLGQGRVGSIGVPMPSTEVRILKDDGSEAPIGEPGELCVRGPQVMPGYYNKPDETAKVIKDGWLHTGDVATIDADGFLRIVDRLKDMIVVSGFKVYPNEVEDCLAKLDGVLESAVLGAPAGEAGEMVVAFVVLKPGSRLSESQVREHCKQSLTPYKVPKVVLFKKEVPKSNVGKILRKELRDEAAQAAAKP
jgi:long-chain acyl-CoA synthetase